MMVLGSAILVSPIEANERLYLMQASQHETWGISLEEANRQKGIVSLILNADELELADTRMIAANEGPEMRTLRQHFIDRRLVQISYTSEVEDLTFTQDVLRTAWLYGIRTLPIRSLEQSERKLQELRSKGLIPFRGAK
jgi:hypothetical protein